MSDAKPPKRRNIFIKKRFQTDFARNFLILIAIESLLGVGLFGYLSRGTIVTGWSGGELVVRSTSQYFLPTFLIASLVIIGVTAVCGFILLLFASHRIAGPLYRFENTLEHITKGDLTHRFKLRGNDQLTHLAEKINEFNSKMEHALSLIQKDTEEMDNLLKEAQTLASSRDTEKRLAALVGEALDKLESLKKDANYFSTSYNLKK